MVSITSQHIIAYTIDVLMGRLKQFIVIRLSFSFISLSLFLSLSLSVSEGWLIPDQIFLNVLIINVVPV